MFRTPKDIAERDSPQKSRQSSFAIRLAKKHSCKGRLDFKHSSKAYFRHRAETRRAEIIPARLGLAWHASVLDHENIAVLKQLYR